MNRRAMFKLLWEGYPLFMVFVIREHPNLVIPKDYPEVAKGLSVFRLEPPLRGANWDDYDEDEDNLYITLSFNGVRAPLRIPWTSIAIFGCEDFQVNWAIDKKDLEPEEPPRPKLSVVK